MGPFSEISNQFVSVRLFRSVYLYCLTLQTYINIADAVISRKTRVSLEITQFGLLLNHENRVCPINEVGWGWGTPRFNLPPVSAGFGLSRSLIIALLPESETGFGRPTWLKVVTWSGLIVRNCHVDETRGSVEVDVCWFEQDVWSEDEVEAIIIMVIRPQSIRVSPGLLRFICK